MTPLLHILASAPGLTRPVAAARDSVVSTARGKRAVASVFRACGRSHFRDRRRPFLADAASCRASSVVTPSGRSGMEDGAYSGFRKIRAHLIFTPRSPDLGPRCECLDARYL